MLSIRRMMIVPLSIAILGSCSRQGVPESERIAKQTTEAIEDVHRLADAGEFSGAWHVLREQQSRLDVSSIHITQYDELKAQLENAEQSLAQDEVRFAERKRNGWVVFEGKQMPGEERDRIIQKRKQQEEDRIAREEQKRAEQWLKTMEERRMAVEAEREIARNVAIRAGKLPPFRPVEMRYYNSADIAHHYAQNEVRADGGLKGKWIGVTGRVTSIGKDIMGDPQIILTGYEWRDVQCGFKCDSSQLDAIAALKPGNTICIMGECRGLMMNVLLRDCWLVDCETKQLVK